MYKIDSHLHVNFGGFDAYGLIEYMDSNGIDKCWLLTWDEINPVFNNLYTNLSIDSILDAAGKYPGRIIPFYAPDPGRKGWFEIMEQYKSMGVKGCGELKATYNWLDDEINIVLDGLQNLSMPLIFHMEKSFYRFVPDENTHVNAFLDKVLNGAFNGLTRKYIEKFINKTGLLKSSFNKRLQYFPGYMMDFVGLESRLKQYPDVNFIAHGPEFWNNIGANPDPKLTLAGGGIKKSGISIELLEKYDNLFADTSGKSGFNALKRDPQFTKSFLNKFYKKILYGTDNEQRFSFEKLILNAGLSKDKLARIMSENAENLCD